MQPTTDSAPIGASDAREEFPVTFPGHADREAGVAQIPLAEWDRRLEHAKDFMHSRLGIGRVLIEVAAQHPLVDGVKPNEEFSERHLRGIELYNEYTNRGYEVIFYVPGSRHVFEGVADNISLADAGSRFLLQHGIPAEAIHGEDLNKHYKGEDGVYNSADECFVAANYFRDGNFGVMIAVMSPVQAMRKQLHYIWFGVYPMIYTAPTLDTFHNPVHEAANAVPHVLAIDPDLQSRLSAWGSNARKERKPMAM